MSGKGILICTCVCLYVGLTYGQGTTINKAGCTNYVTIMSGAAPPDAPIEKSVLLWQAIVLLICFGAFALLVSLLHRFVRTYVYYDAHLLDTFFDAGGDVSFGMIACAVVAKWASTTTYTWSTYETTKYGLVGQFAFAAGSAAPIFLFAIVAAEIRIKAPGAKTFLQVIYRRFGAVPHITAMVFVFIVNIVISGIIMYEGTVILSEVTLDLKREIIAIILAVVVGLFTVIGGFGGFIYVSFFSVVLIFAILLTYFVDVFFDPWDRTGNQLGNYTDIFRAVNCGRADKDNAASSLLTFESQGALLQGILILLSTFTSVFADQGFWSISVAAKPGHSVWGFLTGGLVWFAIPIVAAFTFGMTYWTWTVQSGQHIVSEQQAVFGLLPVVVSQRLIGTTGNYMMFTLTMVVTMTTVASNVLSASAIVIYDIYQTYITPFNIHPPTGKGELTIVAKRALQNEDFLEYDQRCVVLKHVVVICVTCLLIPITLVLLEINIDTPWLYMSLGVVCGGCVVPIILAITWHRVTAAGVTSGMIGGFLAGLISWLVYAEFQPGGNLREFRRSTGTQEVMLVGVAVSLGVGGLLCILVSLCSGGCDKERAEEGEWEKTRAIDNLILPWAVKYAPDIREVTRTKGTPPFYTVRRTFKCAEMSAFIVGVFLFVLMVLVWPVCMLLTKVFTETTFYAWFLGALIWGSLATAFVAMVPLIVELIRTCTQAYYNRAWERKGGMQRLEETDTRTPSPSMGRPMTLDRRTSGISQLIQSDVVSLKSGMSRPESHASTMGADSLYSTQGRPERWKTFIDLK